MNRALLVLLLLTGAARAAPETPPPPVATYALVVGSNAPGPGQAQLRFAEDDARRVAATLADIGGYTPGTVDVLLRPGPDALRARLDRLTRRVAADAAAGRAARVLFYYSGHARATALDLGADALPLDELRRRLLAIPAALKVVVLDACQSGAFSRVKGAAPTADFSFNSRQHLDATGIAVLASSRGSELSQESEHLRSSYFTHHLLVGLRGAGDTNRDGAVSVDEAYRYAYHQTLLATSTTAVGGQHVSLEVELRGHGEVPLAYPRPATAAIELPAALAGHALVSERRAKAVVAEAEKAAGAPLRVAVAPGEYDVIVRTDAWVLRCPVTAGEPLELARCDREPLATAAHKGAAPRAPLRWRLELSAGVGGERDDAYIATLETFGYHPQQLVTTEAGGAVLRETGAPGLWLGAFASHTMAPRYQFETGREPLRLAWTTTRAGALAHAERRLGRWLGVYARAGLGVGIGRTRFTDQDGATARDTFVRPAVELAAGLRLDGLLVPGLGLSLGPSFGYAPIIVNELGDRHDSGGFRIHSGLSWTWR